MHTEQEIVRIIERLDSMIRTKPSQYHITTNIDRWHDFLRRAAEAREAFGHEVWEGRIAPALETSLGTWDKERSLPDDWLDAAQLTRHAPIAALCRWARLRVEHPIWAQPAEALGEALRHPALDTLRALEVCWPRDLGRLLDALMPRGMAGLRSLTLAQCGLGDAEIARMTQDPTLWRGLAHVKLSDNRIRKAGAEALAQCAHLQGLETLELASNPMGKAGRFALGLSPYLSTRAKASARALAAPVEAAPVSAADAREVFGDLRSALQLEPSLGVWAMICDRIARMEPARQEQEAIPHAAPSLMRWPVALRELPPLWVEQIKDKGEVPPVARLARSVRTSGKALNADRAKALGAWARDNAIERLAIVEEACSLKALQALLAGQWPRLKALVLEGGLPDQAAREALVRLEGARLAELELHQAPQDYDVSGMQREVAALASWPALAELEALRLVRGHQTNGALRALVDAPWWWGLRELEWTPLGSLAVEQRALLGREDDPPWTRLERLKLDTFPAQGSTGAAIEALAPRMPALRELSFIAGRGDGLWRVLSAPWAALERLEVLGMYNDDEALVRRLEGWERPGLKHLTLRLTHEMAVTPLHDSAIEAIARSPVFCALEELVVEYGRMDGARAPLVFERLPETLVSLELSYNQLGLEGARALAARELPALKRLRIMQTSLPREGVNALCQASWWDGLEELELEQLWGDHGLQAMAGRLPKRLRRLRLLRTAEDEDVVKLCAGGLPGGLEELYLVGDHVATKGLKALTDQIGGLSRLHTLDLSFNMLTAKSVEPLLQHPALGQIGIISLADNRLGFAGKQRVMGLEAAPVWLKGMV
jgi:hypothetical protein